MNFLQNQNFGQQNQQSQGRQNSPNWQQQQQAPTFSANNNLAFLKQQAQIQLMQQQQRYTPLTQQHKAPLKTTQNRVGPEFCVKHKEANVGLLEDDNAQIVCNTCIFEKKLNDVKFTALVSKELKDQFQTQFNSYKTQMDSVQSIDPNLVKQRASILVQKFFQQLAGKVQALQKGVMIRIKSSDSLKELEKILENSREFFPNEHNTLDHFEREKKKFDAKIENGRFAYLVKRQDFYANLISSLESSSDKMKVTIDQSSDQVQRVLHLRTDTNVVKQQLNEIVKDCIEVDMRSLDPLSQTHSPRNINNHQNHQNGSHDVFQRSPQSSVQTQQNVQQSQYSPNSQQQNQQQQSAPLKLSAVAQSPAGSCNSVFANLPPAKPHSPQKVQAFNQSPKVQQINVDSSPEKSPFRQQQQQEPLHQSPVHQSQSQLSPKSVQSSLSQVKPVQAVDIDEVEITGVNRSEIKSTQFRTLHKLKSMCLLKLLPGRGWAKVYECPGLMMAKCVQVHSPAEMAFVIGGSKDKNVHSINEVQSFYVQPNTSQIEIKQKAPMIHARSNFACTVNVATNEIIVAGGYENGTLTRTCELYSVSSDRWRELPSLNEDKCSSALCVLNGRYVYCLGGLAKTEQGAYLLSTIEMLDLQAPNLKWINLAYRLPQQVCDIGAVPLNDKQILLCGGWNKSPQVTSFILEQFKMTGSPSQEQLGHKFVHVNSQMDKPDFFLVTGVAMESPNEPNKIRICGHGNVFSFNTTNHVFEGSSSF